jgi:arylsulfatase A
MVATFAELVDYDLPGHAAEDSFSILPALLGEETGAHHRPALIADTGRGDFSLRSGSWKLIALNPQPPNQQVVYELYELDEDPYETTNLADVFPDIVEELRQTLNESRRTGLRFLE